MASWQRRRGDILRLYPKKTVTDRRGNQVPVPDLEAEPVRARYTVDRSVRSSMIDALGYQTVDVRRISVEAKPGLEPATWALVAFGVDGEDLWEIISPPQLHRGTSHTRHWTIDIKRRPVSTEQQ